MKRSSFCQVFFLGCVLLASSLLLFFWREIAEQRIKALLNEYGLSSAQFTLGSIGWQSAQLSHIAFGADKNATIDNLTLEYTPGGLWNQRLARVIIESPSITVQEEASGWSIVGLPVPGNSSKTSEKQESSPAVFSTDTWAAWPVDAWEMRNLTLRIKRQTGNATLHGNATLLTGAAKPALDVVLSDIEFSRPAHTASVENLVLNAILEPRGWVFNLTARNIIVTGLPIAFSPIQSTIHGLITPDMITLALTAQDKSGDTQVRGSLDYPYRSSKGGQMKLQQFIFPWMGGAIAFYDVNVPFPGLESIHGTMSMKTLPLQSVIQTYLGKQNTASGTVSGDILFTLHPRRNDITLSKLFIHNDTVGTLSIARDTIPASHAHLELLRDVLQNFHYTTLEISGSSTERPKLEIRLKLEGANPDVSQGKQVKFNMNLGGDVVEFLRDGLRTFSDPASLLQESR